MLSVIGLVLAATLPMGNAIALQPVTTDSRIKTLVFNANEVFAITTHYGYQCNIEFGPKETIETISVGDRVAWQISPAGRRLFIRAQEENAHTNMTVVTNLRAYQFDLRSSSADAVFGSEALTYVVRFFYPDESGMQPPAVAKPAPMPIATGAVPAPVSEPMPAMSPFNYRYTYSGPDAVAPVKIFDDGKSTFFKFNGDASPKIAIVTAKGETLDVPTRRTSDGLIAVNAVAPRFTIIQGGQQIAVYNEAGGAL
jgi:type IV secretion system protein VirB9